MKKTSSGKTGRNVAGRGNGKFRFDARTLVRAAQKAVRAALRQHKRAGNPVVGVVKGKVVLIPASRIKL